MQTSTKYIYFFVQQSVNADDIPGARLGAVEKSDVVSLRRVHILVHETYNKEQTNQYME